MASSNKISQSHSQHSSVSFLWTSSALKGLCKHTQEQKISDFIQKSDWKMNPALNYREDIKTTADLEKEFQDPKYNVGAFITRFGPKYKQYYICSKSKEGRCVQTTLTDNRNF